MTNTPKPQGNTLDEKIMEAIRDGLANHTGEWLNSFVTKDNYTVEQSTQLLNDICEAKRLNNNIQALITEARIDEMNWWIEQYEPLNNLKADRLTQLKEKL